MDTKTLIDRWNVGNTLDRAQLIRDLDLMTESKEVMKANYQHPHIKALFFVACPKYRFGFWWCKKNDSSRLLLTAFRLYPRGLQTYNSWQRLRGNAYGTFGESIQNEFVTAFDGIVEPEHADN